MTKKRLIFTLLYQDEAFHLSRNFRLQRVGDLYWLNNNYRFESISHAIDELIILDVSRNEYDIDNYISVARAASANCFVPLALGGSIKTLSQAERLIRNGADKLVLNTALVTSPDFVLELVKIYGSQCIVASVDYRIEDSAYRVYVDQGRQRLDCSLSDHLIYLKSLQVGEVYLNSIDLDGTGQGYCLDALLELPQSFDLPLIMAGGAGNQHHLLDGLLRTRIDGVATANLFNFVGDGLPKARTHLINHDIDMALW